MLRIVPLNGSRFPIHLKARWIAEMDGARCASDNGMRDRLLAGMRTIGRQPRGFFSTGLVMHLDTGAFDIVAHD